MTAESVPTDRLVGQVLANRYEILHRLGEGAMGVVYKARHVKVGRAFAVKVLHARLLVDPKVAQRFAREAELAGRLRHANVVGVVDVGELDDMHYMVMDFAEGPDLAQLLVEAPMPPARIVRLVRQMLEGLYHAHEQGLIHRDFKPENVIIERDSHGNEMARIVDFGIALLRDGGDSVDAAGRLTTNGLVLGTPHYMAPEQAVADPIDHRIDLFALGIVIYEMLSGRLPFDGSGAEVARANLLLEPPPIAERVPYLEVDPLLEAFSRRLMAKRREHRPADANAARELLDLIDRDRRAAGVALGVPPELSERAPAATQPVVRAQVLTPLPVPTPAPNTVAMRPTPPHATAADLAIARWTSAAPSEPTTSAAPAVVSDPPSARVALPWTPPGPPLVFSAPPAPPQPELDRETAMRTPLDWPAAPPPRRRGRWIAAGAGAGASAVAIVVAWLALREPAPDPAPRADDRVAVGTPVATPPPGPTRAPAAAKAAATDPEIDRPAAAKLGTGDPAPATAGPPPVGSAAAQPAEPAADEPARPELAPPEPAVAADPPRPAPGPRTPRVAPSAGKPPASGVIRPRNAGATPRPGEPSSPVTHPEHPPGEPAPQLVTPAAPVEPAAPAAEPRPVEPVPAEPKPHAPRPCDTSAPAVHDVTPAAFSELYSITVPRAIGSLPKDKQEDLWPRLVHYNVNALMGAPQATRDAAAAALWQVYKEAGCRKAP